MSIQCQQVVNALPAFLQGSKLSFDFNEIRADLKTFLQNQEMFSDYNFDASGLSFILDILAYNAQMNAMSVHLGLNESFLQSAQARTNVVAAANLLGYIPESNSSATAVVNVILTTLSQNAPPFIEISRGTRFSGGGFDWYVTDSKTAQNDAGRYYFYDLNVKEGKLKTIKYFFDSSVEYQRFEIPDADVDLSSLAVNVKDSEYSTFIQSYFRFTAFNEINESSPIYFIQENPNGRYEIYFLNNGVGVHPRNGSVIEITYSYSNADKANGVSLFSCIENFGLNGETKSVITVSRSSGGHAREDKESIRHNAPYHFQTQNRCVTARDYISVIKQNMPGLVESITTWGGEYNTPPEFGRMYIAIKPFGGEKLSDEQKQFIISNVVKPKNVATITPIIVDPEFIWVGLDIISKYDSSKTTNSQAKIEDLIRNTVVKYGENNLQRFDGVLKHSRLLSIIDTTELSIINSAARVYLIKKLIPNPSIINQFYVKIPANLFESQRPESLISSSPITIDGKRHFLEDSQITGDNIRRRVQLIHYDASGSRQIVMNNIGILNLLENSIYLFNLKPDSSEEIRIYFEPNSYDIAPFQNQFLRIDESELKISVENDTSGVIGVSGENNYFAAPRNR